MLKIKIFLISILALLPSVLCQAGKAPPDTISARRAFLEMPVGKLDLLSKNTRFDMLVYYDNDSIYQATNNLKGMASLQTVTDNYLSVRLTDASTLQIRILPLKNGNDIVMTIYTTGREGDALDSSIRFYNTKFEELPTEKFFREPKLSLFFQTKGYKTNMKEIEDMLPFYSIYYQANPDNCNITGKLTLGDILTMEDQRLVEMFLKENVTFVWNGSKFKEK